MNASVNIRLGNNRAIMTSNNTNINDLLDELEYQPDSVLKSMYRLRFRMLEPEVKDIIEGLERMALNITILVGRKKMVLGGYRIYNHSYAIVKGNTPYYDAWVVPFNQA